MLAEALSVFLSITLNGRHEVRGTSLCQDQRDLPPLFIVVSDVSKMLTVKADRRGTSRNQCVCTSCERFNVISDEHSRVKQWLRYRMMPMFNGSLDSHGCFMSSPTIHAVWHNSGVCTYHSPSLQTRCGMWLLSPVVITGAICDLDVCHAKMAVLSKHPPGC